MPERSIIGWDVGGAHVKACLLRDGRVVDVALWACPLWQGLAALEAVLVAARQRWPEFDRARHALTMTGEMVDLFAHREEGVRRIAALVESAVPAASLQCYAGDAGWCDASDAGARWQLIASANWLATARHAARHFGDGVLLDIGSTTTDLIAFSGGAVTSVSRSDAERLASGELVYHGVVRTPLCALARRVPWRGVDVNVMNEFFATSADVYRLTGELAAEHDLYPSADSAAKDPPATRQRLARMIGLDARDGSADEWLTFAQAWRAAQVAELGGQLRRVLAMLPARSPGLDPTGVAAGCGAFLASDVVAAARPREAGQPLPRIVGYEAALRIADAAPQGAGPTAAAARLCAPCVAVALLYDGDTR